MEDDLAAENTSVKTEDSRRRLWLAAGFLVAFIGGTLMLSMRFASAEIKAPSALLALMIVQIVVIPSIWFLGARLARLAGAPATPIAAFMATCLSVSLFLVIPGRVSEAAKPALLRMQTRLPVGRGLMAVALERLLDVGCLAVLAAMAAATAATRYSGDLQNAAMLLTALLCIGLVALLAVMAWPRLGERLIGFIPWPTLRDVALDMLSAVRRSGSPHTLVVAILYSALAWGFSYLIYVMLIALVGSIPLTPAQVLLVFVAATLGFVVTVTPGGLGTYEGAVVLALGSFGYPVADALTIAILLRLANLLPAVAVTAWLFAKGGVGIADLLARMRARREER